MKSSLVLLLAPLAALAAPAPRQAADSIDELIKAKGKLYYGTCTDQNRLSTGKSADIIKGNFGQVTPENSMKWDVSDPFLAQQEVLHCVVYLYHRRSLPRSFDRLIPGTRTSC